jgi:hypothetical protein
MHRWMLVAAVCLPSGCLGLSCTEIGCASTVSIAVTDEDPANRDFDVAVTVGSDVVTCAGIFDPVEGLECGDLTLTPTADGYTLAFPVFAGEEDFDVAISRDGDLGYDGPIDVAWGEPTYPNGKQCDPECINGTAAITIP